MRVPATVEPAKGIEPPTYGLQNRCSARLSYAGVPASLDRAMLPSMPTADELKAQHGQAVTLRMNDGTEVSGTIVGTLDAADGMVVVVDRADQPGARFSCNY